MLLEDLGIIGNCQYAAHIHRNGAVVWCCLPRFDAEPLFATLLDEKEGGRFSIGTPAEDLGHQRYLPNTNVLETTFVTSTGTFRVIDFAPRFAQFERMYRPAQLVRIVEPVDGTPLVSVVCDPRLGWSQKKPKRMDGSNHVRFEGFESPVRLTTDVPLSCLQGQPFTLTQRRHFVLSWGSSVQESLPAYADRLLSETQRYWQRWVKHCNVPPLFQQEIIRSALALKLHCFEDTGAIVASTTTSIPESAHSGRTWDYRYCWLRDVYYALEAFRLLGHFEERENFITYLLNIVGSSPDLKLAPLYRIDGKGDLDEQILTHWPGFHNDGPVRVGNAAALHIQNDIFGEMVLALTPVFLDARFQAERSKAALELIERLTDKAIAVAGTPDAGIWEYRTEWVPQTFSTLMCWAAADRMTRIAREYDTGKATHYQKQSERIHNLILTQAWSEQKQSFVGSHGGSELDASLLQMAALRFLPPKDEKLIQTVHTIHKELSDLGWLHRYRLNDGFGTPEVAFLLCTFWLVEALVVLGEQQEARKIMEHACTALSPLGLLAEDYAPKLGRLSGNFPQAYSHVGLIHAGFAASPRWSEIL